MFYFLFSVASYNVYYTFSYMSYCFQINYWRSYCTSASYSYL